MNKWIDVNDQPAPKDKLIAFSSLSFCPLQIPSKSYNDTRRLLNIEGYNFYFRLFDVYGVQYEGGINPQFYSNDRVTSIRRYVYSDKCAENKCVFEFLLWR